MQKSVINSKFLQRQFQLLKKAFKMKPKKNVFIKRKNTAKKIINRLLSFNFKKYNLKLFYDI